MLLVRGLLKSKIDTAFTRIQQTATELNKVVSNAPDKNADIASTAVLLFDPADLGDVAKNLQNLYDVSHWVAGDDVADGKVLPVDAVSAKNKSSLRPSLMYIR